MKRIIEKKNIIWVPVFRRINKIILVFFVFSFANLSTCKVVAQNQIGDFFGIKLGLSMYETKSKLESQGKTVTSKTTNSTKYDSEYYIVKKPRLGDIVFDEVKLYFRNNKLEKAIFDCYDAAGGSPEAYAAYNRVSNSASRYKGFFNQMRANFAAKYGTPTVDDGNDVIWVNGNILKIKYEFSDVMESAWMRQSHTLFRVEYELSNSSFSNY